MNRREKVELFEQIRREYEFGVGTIKGVARKLKVHRRMVRQAVALIKGRALVEVSGGITLNNVQEMAAAGPDLISIGALTLSAPAATLSLELEPLARIGRKRR